MKLSDMLFDLKDIEDVGVSYIKSDREIFCSYRTLHFLALKMLFSLKSAGLKPKDELIFLSRDKEWGFIIFWACIYGGIRIFFGNEQENDKEQFVNFSTLCKRPYYIVPDDNYYDAQFDKIASNHRLTLPSWDELINYPADTNIIAPTEGDDIAAVIFSSGSINEPKGVSITHTSAISFAKAFVDKMHLQNEDVSMTWMSLGTITDFMVHHIVPLYTGSMQYHMSNQLFSKKPFDLCYWLSEKNVTYTTLINSMFSILASYENKQKYSLDLHKIRYVFVGAEPVTEKACNEFLTSMEKYGLSKNCLKPGYGLSETMSAATILDPNTSLTMLTIDDRYMNLGDKICIVTPSCKYAHTFVSIGTPLDGLEVKISDQCGNMLNSGYIGIIEIKGPMVSCGYYGKNRPIVNTDGWFDTGDIGFLENEHLYIVGRYKDMFIINGRNYYYHDLENRLSLAANIDIHDIVLVCKDSDTNELICYLKQEDKAEKTLKHICTVISDYCLEYYALKVDRFVILKRFPKTNSGKIKRYEMLKLYMEAHADYRNCISIYENTNEQKKLNEILKDLQEIFSRILNENIAVDDDYLDYIGDSIYLSKIHLLIDSYYPNIISLAQMFGFSTIEDIAEEILSHR